MGSFGIFLLFAREYFVSSFWYFVSATATGNYGELSCILYLVLWNPVSGIFRILYLVLVNSFVFQNFAPHSLHWRVLYHICPEKSRFIFVSHISYFVSRILYFVSRKAAGMGGDFIHTFDFAQYRLQRRGTQIFKFISREGFLI